MTQFKSLELAVAFESVINVRACDETKNIIVEKFFNATGSSMWKNFQITLPLSQKTAYAIR